MSKSQFHHPNASLYCDLMEFIKWRVGLTEQTLGLVRAKKHYLDNRSAAEFCLLQLRFCCELLAIGCVAIHTDVPQASSLHKEWNAEKIMKTFEKLKPQFFPEPIKDELGTNGIWEQTPAKGALTRDELLKMYKFFGGLLHTGSFRGYKNPQKRTYDFDLLANFASKFVKLLNTHVYKLNGDDKMIRVIMWNEKDGRVWLNELELVERKSSPTPSSSDSPAK
jgi:hypothetical protein